MTPSLFRVGRVFDKLGRLDAEVVAQGGKRGPAHGVYLPTVHALDGPKGQMCFSGDGAYRDVAPFGKCLGASEIVKVRCPHFNEVYKAREMIVTDSEYIPATALINWRNRDNVDKISTEAQHG